MQMNLSMTTQLNPFSNAKPKLSLTEEKEVQVLKDLSDIAKEIVELKTSFSFINANQDEIPADRVALRLTASEQEFFLLFNHLREIKGFEPLKGERFTGDFSYESYLY